MSWNPSHAVSVGRNIRRLTQQELADELTRVSGGRWTRDMVASLENGRRKFDVDTLMDLSKALDLSTDFFLFGRLNEAKGVSLSSLALAA